MACMNACPKNAISIIQDGEGFLIPEIIKDKCVECRLCERACPEVQELFHQHVDMVDVYAGWNKIDRQVSSSGGAFSSIARFILGKCGYVYGAILDDNMQCKHIEVKSVEDLKRLRGSKYIQSNPGTIFRLIKKRLLDDKYVLFSGTPCQVSGLKSYLNKDYSKLFTIDLVCHGVPSNALFSSYITKLQKKLHFPEKERIVNFEFRRREGWGFAPSFSTSTKSCVKLYGINALYMSAFDRAAIFRQSCYHCHYANIQRVGDFSIGDFWGLGHQGVPFKYDMTKGVSLLLVNSDKGRVIMSQLGQDDFYIKRTIEEATAYNHNLTHSSYPPENREEIIRAFLNEEEGLTEIEKEYHLLDKSIKKRLSQLSSRIGLYDLLKKALNIIR